MHKVGLTFWRDAIEKMQMYPPVEAPGGQEQYYIGSAWNLQSCIRLAWHFEEMQLRRCRHTPLVEASGGQEQYNIRSASHLPFAHLLFSYWRAKSYIAMWDILLLSNLCTLIFFVVVTIECCCCSSVIVDVQLQINKNNKMQK